MYKFLESLRAKLFQYVSVFICLSAIIATYSGQLTSEQAIWRAIVAFVTIFIGQALAAIVAGFTTKAIFGEDASLSFAALAGTIAAMCITAMMHDYLFHFSTHAISVALTKLLGGL